MSDGSVSGVSEWEFVCVCGEWSVGDECLLLT